MKSRFFGLLIAIGLGVSGGACASSTEAAENAESAESAILSDAVSITRREDGAFNVRCSDGRWEVATSAQIAQGQACKPVSQRTESPDSQDSNDLFSNASCTGAPMTIDEAERRFPFLAVSVVVTTAKEYIRSRECVQRSRSTECDAWTTVPNMNRLYDLNLKQRGTDVVVALGESAYRTNFINRDPNTQWEGTITVGQCGSPCESGSYIKKIGPTVVLTNSCVRLNTLRSSGQQTGRTTWTEHEAVVFARF